MLDAAVMGHGCEGRGWGRSKHAAYEPRAGRLKQGRPACFIHFRGRKRQRMQGAIAMAQGLGNKRT